MAQNRAKVWEWVAAGADGRPVSVQLVCDTAAAQLGMDGVGLSVARHPGRWAPWYTSDALSARLEEVQVTTGEGPGAEVLAGGGSVLIGDLDSPQSLARWPGFTPVAVASGVGAVFAFPLQVGAIRVGVFSCYHSQPRVLGGEQLDQCLMFAELALQLVLGEQAGWPSSNTHPWPDGVAMNRPEIHQATGMISVQLGVSVEEAFTRLRARAFADDRPLSALARDVVERRLRFVRDGHPR